MKKLTGLLLTLTMCFFLTHPLTANASTIDNKDYVKYEYVDTGTQLIVTLTNVSTQTISLTVAPNYTDANGREILVYSKDIVTFEPGRTAVKVFDYPVGYKGVSVAVTVNLDYYLKGIGITNQITQSQFDITQIGKLFALTENNSQYTAKTISYTILYYKDGRVVSAKETTLNDLGSGYKSYAMSDGVSYNYKIILNEAFY